MAGAAAVEIVIPRSADQMRELKHQRALLATEVEKLVDDLPLSQVVISLPGVGGKTTATSLQSTGDSNAIKSTAHLVAYAGIAPISRYAGISIHAEHPSRSRNKALKDAIFPSAWVTSCHGPLSSSCFQRKGREKEPQYRHHVLGPTPLRRPLRHAQKRHPLRKANPQNRLTKSTGTPCDSVFSTATLTNVFLPLARRRGFQAPRRQCRSR